MTPATRIWHPRGRGRAARIVEFDTSKPACAARNSRPVGTDSSSEQMRFAKRDNRPGCYIFFLAGGICTVRAHGDFSADDAEQAFVSGIEYARARIPCGRNIADHRGKPLSDILRKQPRRHDPRLRRASGTATMTGSPGHGGVSQSGMRRMRKLTGSFSSSTDSRVKSTPQRYEPCLIAFAGRSRPAICTSGWYGRPSRQRGRR
jgi:hypothetical protein